ncbi:hypothetical protein SCP_0801950 [Sparassis crispa]|uniref:Uncharacterized protein n=1 Tax=Sparassis crispa TaxID=139825 RepID=A0A401GU16_9APHY|nr:hypothetical protein SCP_0801950 [Sparassis crispa]GBE85673.1 hypothetical protein SCP_0801950 [Sparassis crispa]
MQEFEAYKRYEASIDALDLDLHSGGDGWVSIEDYPQVVDTWGKNKREWDKLERGGPFPYDDGMFSFFLS